MNKPLFWLVAVLIVMSFVWPDEEMVCELVSAEELYAPFDTVSDVLFCGHE